jgi:hypothetical protein
MEIKSGLYRHYKGKYYAVIGMGMHSESREELVFYIALYDDAEFGENSLWVRPKEMFMEKVKVDGKELPRFEYIKDKI